MATAATVRRALDRLAWHGYSRVAENAKTIERVVAYVAERGGGIEDAVDAVLMVPRPSWLLGLIGSEMIRTPTSDEVAAAK